MTPDRIRVLFIAGAGRSGSTVLHDILGQIDGVAAVGELREIWHRGVAEDYLCGCGAEFSQCDVWTDILDRATSLAGSIDPEAMASLTESFRIKHLPLTWIPALRSRQLSGLARYLRILGALYTAIRDVTDCRIILDSSKNPSYGYLLSRIPELDVAYLQLLRDPRSVAYSWSTRKMFEPGKAMARKPHLTSALQWNARNLATELFLPHDEERKLCVRYEDIMADPRGAVAGIANWLDVDDGAGPFESRNEATLDRVSHSVFGNPSRFQRGRVVLQPDERWRDGLAPESARLIEAVTWPLRRRYGYVRTTRTGAEAVGSLGS